ncbi:MAG: hypothetical protein IT567_05050 [Alphaproteobacteria bacterium]|nr:hypothetical protein [Alphaproteobacteria bacterium]
MTALPSYNLGKNSQYAASAVIQCAGLEMLSILRAAFLYFTLVFAAGFALGAIRTLGVTPRMGEFAATLIELPLILFISWHACAFVLRRAPVPTRPPARLLMGGIAFGLLIIAETTLGVVGLGRSLSEQIASYAAWGPATGLLAQFAYALFPYLQSRSRPTSL